MGFSRAQLEGRAVEHELARDRRRGIRMRRKDGSWKVVTGPKANTIRWEMRKRVASFLDDLKRFNLIYNFSI